MNFLRHITSFMTLVSGLSLIFVGILFVNNTMYKFIPPLCVISGFAIFFCSMIIFDYEPIEKKNTNFITDLKDVISEKN